MAEVSEIETRSDEQAKVEGWRLHVLVEAGYPSEFAQRLAASEVDLHEAVGLLESGCSADIATRILL